MSACCCSWIKNNNPIHMVPDSALPAAAVPKESVKNPLFYAEGRIFVGFDNYLIGCYTVGRINYTLEQKQGGTSYEND